MKYVQQVFDRLSRGGFLASDSVEESKRLIFIDLDDHKELRMVDPGICLKHIR